MSAENEFKGKNVEAALQKASNKLNIPVEKIKYDVISYGSSGIFGLVGSKKARIKVSVPKEKKEKRNETRKEIKTKDISEPKNGETFTDTQEKREPESIEPDDQEAVEQGKQALEKIIGHVTNDATVSVERDRDRYIFRIEGGNAAVLIGKRGQTLEAIQYLVEKMINSKREKRIRILIDVENYLNNRQESLKRLAYRLSEKAKKSGKPRTMGQMSAQDRRVVHLALKNDRHVRTQSMGEGYFRKLVIFPKQNSHQKGNRPNEGKSAAD